MSLHGGSVFSRLSKRSAIRGSSTLAFYLGNDNTMRKLLRDGIGIRDLQKKYLSLCYASRPSVRPNKEVAQALGAGELVWNLTVCEKQETSVIAALLTTKEAYNELRSVVISAGEAGCPSVRQRAGMARSRAHVFERDPGGQMEVFNSLCKALPLLKALRSLELEGLRRAFDKSGAGAARLGRGLKGNTKLKSLAVHFVRFSDPRALGPLMSALAKHPSLVALSLRHCGLVGEAGGRLVASVIKAHGGRREAMVWSAGLRRPSGVVGNTAAAAPGRITTAGCLAVDLSGNLLGDAGVHAVARGLQNDTWLMGLNLSNNEVTDRGAALLSVCLQHNGTLCALVLDDNPAVGEVAERRIAEELKTRSTMPEVVLEEREVVLMLASWGFTLHTTPGDDDKANQQQEREGLQSAASDSVMSEISEHSPSDGFPVGEGDRRDNSAVMAASHQPQTSVERTKDHHLNFQRPTGYSNSSLPPAPPPPSTSRLPSSAAEGPSREAYDYTTGHPSRDVRANRSNTRVPSAIGTREPIAGQGWTRHHARTRSLSSSSRSTPPTHAAGRMAKRSKSCGPGRDVGSARSRSWTTEVVAGRGAAGSGAAERVPWGAGPRAVGGARARAQAWASTHLAVVRSAGGDGGDSGGGGGGRGRRAGRIRGVSAGGGVVGNRNRVRRARGGVGPRGGSVGNEDSGGRRPAKGRGRKNRGGARKARRAGAHVDRSERDRSVENGRFGGGVAVVAETTTPRERTPRRREVVAAQDCSLDAHDQGGGNGNGGVCPELTPRRQGSVLDESMMESERVAEGARTDRVVNMLAALEEVVMGICQDMWRLEDRVEANDTGNASHRSSDEQEGEQEEAEEAKVASEVNMSSAQNGPAVEDNNDGSAEVAAQVEARLRDMWQNIPRSAPDSPFQGQQPALAEEKEEEDEATTAEDEHNNSSGMQDLTGVSPVTEAMWGRGVTEGETEERRDIVVDELGDDAEEEGLFREEGRGGGGAEAERFVPADIGGHGRDGAVYEEEEGDDEEDEGEGDNDLVDVEDGDEEEDEGQGEEMGAMSFSLLSAA